jgi:serine protease Do
MEKSNTPRDAFSRPTPKQRLLQAAKSFALLSLGTVAFQPSCSANNTLEIQSEGVLPSQVRSSTRNSQRPQKISQSPSNNAQTLSKTAAAFNEVAQKATPAVVSVSVIKSGSNHPGKSNPLEPQKSQGIGSGVIIHQDGYVLTNNHVVENAEKITIKFDEKHKVPARIVGTDPKTDLAVLKIDKGQNLPTLSFGDSSQIKVGDWAIAIGSPFGLNRSMSKGIISAVGRAQMGILEIEDFIQTDAAINPGSSGGPLLNIKGEMIGINTAIFSQGGGFVGIGFAIPASIAREVAEQLIAKGKMQRGWIGISVQDLDEDLARYFKIRGTSGALVTQVTPKSPAEKAALQPGDVILKFNRKPVEKAFDLKTASSKCQAGSSVMIEFSRDGTVRSMTIKVEQQASPFKLGDLFNQEKGQKAGQKADKAASQPRSSGLVIEDIPQELAKLLEVKDRVGVLVAGVEPGSPASEAGLAIGDIILQADKERVQTAKDFHRITKKLADQELTMLYVQRGSQEKLFIPLRNRA